MATCRHTDNEDAMAAEAYGIGYGALLIKQSKRAGEAYHSGETMASEAQWPGAAPLVMH